MTQFHAITSGDVTIRPMTRSDGDIAAIRRAFIEKTEVKGTKPCIVELGGRPIGSEL